MPIYEYNCPLCGHFEAMQGMSEKPLKCKPDCQEKKCPKKAERLISSSAFHLVGGGWYKSDYSSSKGATTTNSAPSNSDSKSDSGSSSGESAPASGKKCNPGCGCH
jgi:putative FmdB family regulatory protein